MTGINITIRITHQCQRPMTVHINVNGPVGVSSNDNAGMSINGSVGVSLATIGGLEGRAGGCGGSVSIEVDRVVQEAKQVERQQHSEEQHRLHISAGGLNGTANGTAGVNATDHVDDFLARIDKLRQVGSYHQDASPTHIPPSIQQCTGCSPVSTTVITRIASINMSVLLDCEASSVPTNESTC